MGKGTRLEVVGGGEARGGHEAEARLAVELALEGRVRCDPLVGLRDLRADRQDLRHPHLLQVRHAYRHHLQAHAGT